MKGVFIVSKVLNVLVVVFCLFLAGCGDSPSAPTYLGQTPGGSASATHFLIIEIRPVAAGMDVVVRSLTTNLKNALQMNSYDLTTTPWRNGIDSWSGANLCIKDHTGANRFKRCQPVTQDYTSGEPERFTINDVAVGSSVDFSLTFQPGRPAGTTTQEYRVVLHKEKTQIPGYPANTYFIQAPPRDDDEEPYRVVGPRP